MSSGDSFVAWIFRQETHLRERLEHHKARRETLREYEALRARHCWDADRRCEVEELGAKLARKPAAVRAKLGRSKQGALWLIDRWKALGNLLHLGTPWDEAQTALAFDLLGVAKELRIGDPWSAAGLASPRALVDRELATLRTSITSTLDELDAFEAEEARKGVPIHASPEMLALGREEAACWRRLLALQKMIEREFDDKLAEAKALESPVQAEPESDARMEADPPPPPPVPPRSVPSSAPLALPTRIALSDPLALSAPASIGNRRARRAAARLARQL
jgi:hypothetical protein